MVMVASIFRNGTPYLDRYFSQVEALQREIPVRLFVAEGDSIDGTWELLCAQQFVMPDLFGRLLKVDHGGPAYGSVDDPDRWKQIAYVWNRLLDQLPQAGNLILVEADLEWDTDTMLALLGDLTVVDAVAAPCFNGERFYDTWGFRRLDGTHISEITETALTPILSAGSCIAMRPEVYRDCRFSDDEGIVGFCRDIQKEGMRLFMDPNVRVEHPRQWVIR